MICIRNYHQPITFKYPDYRSITFDFVDWRLLYSFRNNFAGFKNCLAGAVFLCKVKCLTGEYFQANKAAFYAA